jgi:hypothetical protein
MRNIVLALAAALALALPVPAQAQARPQPGLQQAVAACVDQIIRQVPSWGAMRKFREQMRTVGFTAANAGNESDPRRGRSWTVYHVQIRGEKNAYRISCER